MTISIIKRTTKYFSKKEGEPEKEPEIKEKTLSEFRTTSDVATAMLQLVATENTYPIVTKDGDIEISKWIENCVPKIEEELIVRFAK